MSFSTILAIITAVLTVAGSPASPSPITLPFVKVVNTTGTVNIIHKDRARIESLMARMRPVIFEQDSSVANVPITNDFISYIASVGIGNPATTYALIVDTGSSNTWVGASQSYVKTPTSVDTGHRVSVEYGSGSFFGEEYADIVAIGPLVIGNQSIGVAEVSSGFNGVDGILGLGPTDLTEGTLSSDVLVPTVVDNAFSQNLIPTSCVAVSFQPATSESSQNGELSFGGTDSSKYNGSITFTKITSTSPASVYWGIDQSISYGSTTIMSTTAGIVDTGTTLLLLCSDAFERYQEATGATFDLDTGLLSITSAQFGNLQNLDFSIGGRTFTLTPDAQIWPRSLNAQIGGTADSIYLVVADLGSPSGEGLDFINGQAFLERFYSVYDTAGGRVGLATTPFTTATSNY